MSVLCSQKFMTTATLMLLALGARGTLLAQGGVTAKAAAPIDLAGYWVAVVTEDWRWRMVTPAKGDYASIPITAEAKKTADLWDPAKDEAAGEQCKSYGAPALMRIPARLHITWQDDATLKVEVDAGTQTRLLHFGNWKSDQKAATWQGDSLASWESPRAPAGGAAESTAKAGNLKVTTGHLRPGYLRKNGVPYSANAVLTEYWDLLTEHHLSANHKDEQWLVITSVVNDPQYLQIPWLASLHFKKEASGEKWDPQPCSARW